MEADIQNPAFTDEDKAREAFEAVRWPDGPVCPHCGNSDQEKIAKGEGKARRPGLYYCTACNGQFTVTVGTVMERSKIPLPSGCSRCTSWRSSKKGMSAHQLHRMLGVTYKTRVVHGASHPRSDDRRARLVLWAAKARHVQADETYYGNSRKRSKRYKAAIAASRALLPSLSLQRARPARFTLSAACLP